MSYVVYILYSQALNKFYIGHTGDLTEERIRRHLTGHDGFTSTAKDWQIVYQEKFEHKTSAAKRERELKSWKSSTQIRALIEKSDK